MQSSEHYINEFIVCTFIRYMKNCYFFPCELLRQEINKLLISKVYRVDLNSPSEEAILLDSCKT
jgi:predicted nucleic-acid-binding protein